MGIGSLPQGHFPPALRKCPRESSPKTQDILDLSCMDMKRTSGSIFLDLDLYYLCRNDVSDDNDGRSVSVESHRHLRDIIIARVVQFYLRHTQELRI